LAQTDASLSCLDSKKSLEIHIFLKVDNLFIVCIISKAMTKRTELCKVTGFEQLRRGTSLPSIHPPSHISDQNIFAKRSFKNFSISPESSLVCRTQ